MTFERLTFFLFTIATGCCLARDPLPTPVADPARLMPLHGTVSTVPAARWEQSVLAGNGSMGVALAGSPQHDVLIGDHCKLWLPTGAREMVFPAASFLPELRSVLAGGVKSYRTGQDLFVKKAVAWGWGGPTGKQIIWTDAFHPGFFLNIDQPQDGAITDYARVENFSTGEVWAQWHSPDGDFKRKIFVSRPDNTIVSTMIGPAGKVSLALSLQPVASPLITSTSTFSNGWILTHNVYVQGKGGYDTVFRIITDGGSQTSDGKSITITDANSVTVLSRIVAWRTPLPGSEAWEANPANPELGYG